MSYNHREILKIELNEINKGKIYDKVLEIGAGGNSFKDSFNCNEYITSDKNNKSEMKFDVINVPYNDNTFECIFMSHCFEHFENPIKALKEINRVLKPDGYIIYVTPAHCEKQIIKGDVDHIFVLTEMQSKKLLMYTGYKDIKVYTQYKMEDVKIDKEQNYNMFSIARK